MQSEPAYTIMLVEDDPKIAEILTEELGRYGYSVSAAQDFSRVKESFIALEPHLVLMDINLPRFDGYYWCRQIRTLSKVPIIFLSARDGDIDQVRALENGADDYVTKPFNLELLLAKVRSALRRTYGEYAQVRELNILQAGDLLLNKSQNQISYQGQGAILTAKEFRLLWLLAERPDEIITREEIMEALWDDQEFVDDNTLTVNVARVRRRLEELGLSDAIETKRGQGYRLNLIP